MSAPWTCATCRAGNPTGTTLCEQCGARALIAPNLSYNPCKGRTERGPCTFRAEVGLSHLEFCSWHHRVHHDDRANTFAEFERWRAGLLAARICDRWTHFTASMLWDGLSGMRGHEAPGWCGGGDCPFVGLPLMPGARTTPPPRPGRDDERPTPARARLLERARSMVADLASRQERAL
jgi:hypothetical protein